MSLPLINITKRHAYIFAGFLVLYEFLTYIANDMIMPGMLEVVKAFNAPEALVATSLTVYIFGGASLQLFLGPISDRYGRRPVMLFGAAFFLLCTVLIACSNSIEHFLIARFFQGMGLCFISVIGYATLQEIFDEMDAIRLIAIMANIAILAPLLGPLAGALFIHYYSWRIIFIVIGIFAFFDLLGLWHFMPESVGQLKKDGQEIKRTSLSLRVVLTNYFALIKNKEFVLGSFAEGFLGLPCMLWIAFSPIILIKVGGLSVLEYGIWQIPIFGAAVIGNWWLQRLTYKFKINKIIVIGSFIMGAGLLLLFLLPLININFIWLMPGIIIYFLGVGIVNAPLSRFILFSTPVAKGTTSALMTIIAMCIQGIGIEWTNRYQAGNNNITFGICCAVIGVLYFCCLYGAFLAHRGEPIKSIEP